eukprot:gene10714-14386_t
MMKVGHLDISSMEKSEISKQLFGQIQWEEILRSGVVLKSTDHQLLERSQGILSVILDNPQQAKDLASMLIKIAENCVSNLTVQQYAFTRIEEILGLGGDYEDADKDAYGVKHAHLFTVDGVKLADISFVRALSIADIYTQKSAALSFACLLTATEGDVNSLINWIISKLTVNTAGVWDMGLPPLGMIARSQSARKVLVTRGIVNHLVSILKRLGANGNAQHIYELCFILWTLSLGEIDINAFLTAGVIPVLVELVSTAPTRKITRMSVAALKNLSVGENDVALNEMLSAGLLKLLESIIQSNTLKQANDIEVEHDIRYLHDILSKNYKELSTFDRWKSEINSGSLRWGIVHNEKFWKENAKFVEADNFALLKSLISYLRSSDP